MTKNEQTKLYKENQATINGMSVQIAGASGVSVDEIRSEANFIFCECCDKYKPEIGAFSKFFGNALYFRLYKYCRKRSRQMSELHEDITPLIDSINCHSDNLVDITLENLSRDGRQAVELVFNLAPEYAERKRKLTKGRLKHELRGTGWTHRRVERAFHEIACAIQ